MSDLETQTVTHLVIMLGFSRNNARRALELFRAGQLSRVEEEVINRIQLNPRSDKYPAYFWIGEDCPVRRMESLNYRITMGDYD